MRTRTSVALALIASPVLFVALAALAQPRSRGAPRPKPTPAASKIDAGPVETASPEDVGATPVPVTTATAPSVDAGPPSQAQLVQSYYDGGLKPSPLNPGPNEFASAAAPSPSGAVDYDKLLGDISTLRARVATVGDSLFHSRIAIAVQTDGDHAPIQRLTVSLDDGVVYTAPANFRPEDMTLIYDHAVAPGRHAVTIDVERKDDRDEAFRTAQRSRLVVDVPKDQRLALDVKILDDSTMGADFPGDRSGRYDLRVRAKASARPVGK